MPRFCSSVRGLGHQSSPPNCFCKRRRFVFSSPRQLLFPGTVVRPVYMEESAKGVWGGRYMAALLETGKQMFPCQPRGVTSAHGLRPRCLHDTGLGQQIAVRQNQMEALFATPAARKPLTSRHRANTAPLHGFTRGRSGRSNQDQQVQNEFQSSKAALQAKRAGVTL